MGSGSASRRPRRARTRKPSPVHRLRAVPRASRGRTMTRRKRPHRDSSAISTGRELIPSASQRVVAESSNARAFARGSAKLTARAFQRATIELTLAGVQRSADRTSWRRMRSILSLGSADGASDRLNRLRVVCLVGGLFTRR